MFTKGRKKGTVRFSINPGDKADAVSVAGDFDGWELARMRKQRSGDFVAVLPVLPGLHEYKFVIDGRWIVDPDNNVWALNRYGTLNSVARVE